MLRRVVSLALGLSALTIWVASPAQGVPPAPAIVTGLDAGWPDVRGWNRNGVLANQWAPWGEWQRRR
jgi:hypothetical protein